MAQAVKYPPAIQETQVRSLGQEGPLQKEIAIHCVFLPEESHGQRSLAGYSSWDHKESDITKGTCHSTQLINSAEGSLALALLCYF